MWKPVRFLRKKLLNIKTARFYGKVFIGCPPYGRGTQEIAERQNIYILERRCLLNRTYGSCSKSCAKQKRYVFVMRCFLGPLGPKKLLDDKIFIFWREGVFS
jgi:hypothetical protein